MAFVVGFVIAIICGVIVGNDATSRGMNGFGWGLFVTLLCIVALPLYLIVRKPLQPPAPAAAAVHGAQPTKRCPYCAEAIRFEAIKCRYCGSDLPPLDSHAARPELSVPATGSLPPAPAKNRRRFSTIWLADAEILKNGEVIELQSGGHIKASAARVLEQKGVTVVKLDS